MVSTILEFEKFKDTYPYPISIIIHRYLSEGKKDSFREWELLSRDIFQSVLMYLSHILLSDLVSTGKKPANLYHKIQSILSRPLNGNYVGFLRETSIYYKQEELICSIPELIDFIHQSEIECKFTIENKPLLNLLNDYRQLFFHGRIENEKTQSKIVGTIRDLTLKLLEQLDFLKNYPLITEDGTLLMGIDTRKINKETQPMRLLQVGELNVRPLLLKLKGKDISLLEDVDFKNQKLAYKGGISYTIFKKNEIKKGAASKIFEELKELLKNVRSMEADVNPDWETFKERSSVITDMVLSFYEEMGKYRPNLYVSRKNWEGRSRIYNRFLESDKTLFAINGVQGTGKSALVSKLAMESEKEGHAVLFINAQRFTFAEVIESSINPYPKYFSQILHYKKEFNNEAINKIIKNGNEGKLVILFIDAINEVDGFTQSWNKFRAMELLLDWICEIAQPNLKVVLSFRLEVYEDFDYLRNDNIPEILEKISFLGINKSKSWIWDLEPFNEDQAKQLFEKLQRESQMGMAPKMSWEKIKEELNEKLESIITNPLIFTVFLRAHHNEEEVIERNREAIFERYAGKLTGGLENKKKSWWQKVWGFIRNGNITKKELFLTDMIGKMSEEGGSAFLIESLNPKKKRDKRLKNIFDNPNDKTLDDLKDGEIISEENIEYTKEGKQIYSRRISFSGELMLPVLNGFKIKKESQINFRNSVITTLGTILILVLFSELLIFIINNNILVNADQQFLLQFNNEIINPWRYSLYLLCLIIISLSVVYDVNRLKEQEYYSSKDVFFKSISNIFYNEAATGLIISHLLLLIAVGIKVSLIMIDSDKFNKGLFFADLMLFIIPFISLVIYSYVSPKLLLMLANGHKLDISKRYLYLSLNYEFQNNKLTERKLNVKYYLIQTAIASAFLLFYYSIFKFEPLEFTAYSFHDEITLIFSIALTSIHSIVLFGVLGILVVFLISKYCRDHCFQRVGMLQKKRLINYLKTNNITGRRLNFIFLILGIFVFSEVVTFSFKNYTEDSHLFVEELISQNCLVHENDGHISYINLRNSRVSSEILNQIYGLSIDSLAIGINSPVKYVVDQGNDLDFLSIPSNSLTWENEITASILQIYKMKSEYLHSLPISHEVVNLILSDTISTLDNLGSKFPNLRILQFDKAIFPNNNLGDFKLDQNAKIVFLDSTLVFPNSLSFQFEKYFLQFGFSPNKNYSQYKNLERVIIPAEKFNFEFLNYLDKLKLLRFMVKDYPTKTWMNNLKKSIKNSLPNLVNLEFILPNAGREYNAILGKEFINVNGKENILKWLSVIEKEPNLLFKAN